MKKHKKYSSNNETQERLKSAIDNELEGLLVLSESHAWKDYGLTYTFAEGLSLAEQKRVFSILKDGSSFQFSFLVDITAVDWMDKKEPRFEVVYQLLSLDFGYRLCLKLAVDEDSPKVTSVRELWPAANFLEREVWDMYGIIFDGHGDLKRILMYDEFIGHPLRKDYPLRGKQPRVPLRVPELRNTSADMKREQLVSLPVPSRKNMRPQEIPSEAKLSE